MQPRYSPLNQALHWITALCMFAILPLAWVMTNADDKTPGLGAMYNWHKTLGIIVLLVTAFRVVWRFKDGPPSYTRALAGWEKGLAHATYWLFFAALLWMPITGFAMSTFEGHATKLFNLIPTPLLWGKNHALGEQFGQLHAAGQWLIYALILVHLGAVAMHLIFRHDGVLGRMLPANAAEPPSDIPASPTRH